jgi:hypothetical protein
MNFESLRKSLLLGAVATFVWWAWKAPAQDTVNVNAPASVPYAVSQVIELEQAKIGDDTVIAYIRSSGNNYNLSANDILYLRQQGVSDTVLTAMLTQPRANVAMASSYSQAAAPAPQYSEPAPQYSAPAPAAGPDTSTYGYDAAPAAPVTYVQSAPTTYYYPSSYYYPYSYYNYPSYSYYGYYGWPRPWYGWGWGWWGGGWHWGAGWHGGWNTGWHGGGWGGGGFHGVVGGGFHGSAGVSSFHGGGGGGFHGGGGGGFHGGGGHR